MAEEKNFTEEQTKALERIKEEYPEYAKEAEQILKGNGDLQKYLSVLDSCY